MSANDPQIQMAEDTSQAIANGQKPESLVPAVQVDIAQSLAAYLIILDNQGNPLASNAVLNEKIPPLPNGVLDYTRQQGQDRISYQPEPGVRSALVVVSIPGDRGFVIAGRSLREVEKRENTTEELMAAGWMVTMAATLFITLIVGRLIENNRFSSTYAPGSGYDKGSI